MEGKGLLAGGDGSARVGPWATRATHNLICNSVGDFLYRMGEIIAMLLLE